MRCMQVEARLNQLLDERRHWTGDPGLVSHCAQCLRCRATAEAYAAVADAVNLERVAPGLPPDFSGRVLSDVGTIAKSSPALRVRSSVPIESPTHSASPPWQRWVIAAILLVAAVPCGILLHSGGVRQIDSQGSATSPAARGAAWQFHGELAQLLNDAEPSSEFVWRSTGRGIAELPHQVRRAAALSESAQLNAAIRPVAVAWHALRQVLPREAIRPEPGEGKTGSFNQSPVATWA